MFVPFQIWLIDKGQRSGISQGGRNIARGDQLAFAGAGSINSIAASILSRLLLFACRIAKQYAILRA
jgi:hypothetical protein